MTTTERQLPHRVRARRERQAARLAAPFAWERTANQTERAVAGRIRDEVRAHVLAFGARRARALLIAKWREDEAAVRRGVHPLELPHGIRSPQQIAGAQRAPRRTARSRARRTTVPGRRRCAVAGRTDDGGSDDDGSDGGAYSTPARSLRREVLEPSRLNAARKGARRA